MKLFTAAARNICLTLSVALLFVSSLFLSPSPAAAATHTVKMGGDTGMLVFQPDKLNVKPGDTVQFVVNKVPPHNVVFDDKAIPGNDKALAKSLSHQNMEMTPGSNFEITIPKDAPAGEYTYFCAPHRSAGMVGKLIVG
ncbi:plastocyanin [Leptothermofonsia sichuanensis E412]|jgi:plastocyanin|uniref:plastocyanin n=1 Tax=Leptothermofonsia sichuanensis TaxID=2917832 RepID=UPI001CA67844|nr:plastocyanin [Leptothermofonsia sichuanensis]QZZ19003.1 plastocyanin [Leptothermofonsia sichuanensis E412]